MTTPTRQRRAPRNEHPVHRWARDVVSGKFKTNKMVRMACERHLRDLEHGAERGLWFDEAAANRVVEFFGFLKQRKGRWAQQPIELSESQVFRIGSVFGWKRADGTRRFRVAYNEFPRKYGKTTEAAGVCNYLAFFDGEPGAEVYATATKKDQARICWSEAKWQMSNAPAQIKRLLDIRVANMNRPDNASKFEAIGADEDSTDGLNPHGIGLDEIHAWKSEEFLGKLETAGGARTQPLRWMITTAGTQTSTLYLRERAYAESVLKGAYDDDSWFVFISCADDAEKWEDEEQWELAYAGHLGRTVTIDFLRDEYKRAAVSPAKQSMFKRMYLGLITSSADAWLTPATWDAQAESIGVDTGARATVGVDLASIRDIAAVIWWFPDEDGDGGELVAKLYMPKANVQKRVEEDGVPYDAWAEAGWIVLTDGQTIDYDEIEADFREMAEEYQVASVGIDPWQGVQFRAHLERDGFTVVKIPQNAIRLDAVVAEAERLLEIGRVRCANPVMRWMALNAVTVTDNAGKRKLDKEKSAEKIDGIAAWLNAMHEAMAMAPNEEEANVFFA